MTGRATRRNAFVENVKRPTGLALLVVRKIPPLMWSVIGELETGQPASPAM